MLMIAITDTRRIRFFVGGFPGSRGDSLAFRARSWSSSMENSDAPMRPMADGEFILGDSGFGLTAFLITPFREADMYGPNAVSMRRFNHLHAKMRVVVENAFGRLKGRWNVLRMICAHPGLASSIQEAAIALHNFLEARDGAYDGTVEEEADREEVALETPEGDECPLSLGAQRRVGILKALGLPWVDEE